MKKWILPVVAVGGLIAVGCSPKYYSPNTQNVPLIKERGQVNLSVTGSGNQVEFQGAYGLTQNVAIQANAGLFIPGDESNGNGGSGKFAEGGVGFFRPIGEHFVFETYGLFGFGSLENHLPSTVQDNPGTTGNISASLVRYGIQPNFGFTTKYFTIAVSSRILMLNYYNVNGNLVFDNRDQVSYLGDNRSNFLLEPALTIRGGLEKLKLQFQIGNSFNVTNNHFRQNTSFATLGLNFNLR